MRDSAAKKQVLPVPDQIIQRRRALAERASLGFIKFSKQKQLFMEAMTFLNEGLQHMVINLVCRIGNGVERQSVCACLSLIYYGSDINSKLQIILDIVVSSCGSFGLKLNMKKTKFIIVGKL